MLARLGLDKGACYVEHASMDEERVCALKDVDGDAAPYFSMVLVRREEGASP